MTKRSDKKVRLREGIIDAAQTVFFEKGYQGSTMDDVCRCANISKRTLYVYFASKEQLTMAVLNRGFDVLVMRFQTIEENDVIERLNWIIRTFVRFSIEHPDYFLLIAQFENQSEVFISPQDDAVMEVYRKANHMFNILHKCLKEGMEANVLADHVDPMNAAIILWSSLFGICTTMIKKRHYMKYELNRSAEEIAEDTLALLRYALLKKSGENL